MIDVDYLAGLDLGQATDPSALCVLERAVHQPDWSPHLLATGWRPEEEPPQPIRYSVKHLHRWHLGTPYPQIVADVRAVFSRPHRSDPGRFPLWGAPLLIDGTGVGRGIVDMFRQAGGPWQLRPVTITAGSHADFADGYWHVPKKDLVGCVQVLLGCKRLVWPIEMPLVDQLEHELQSYRVRITKAAKEVFGAWREGDHDDLVLALALAAWWGERVPPVPPGEETLIIGRRRDR